MIREREKYFEFLVEAVELDDRTERFSMLLEYLFEKKFTTDKHYQLDDDRVENGLSMREKYAEEYIDIARIDRFLDDFGDGISMLEFLVSMCNKMSETIFFDSHLSEFFWQIIDNLGLDSMTDEEFDESVVDNVLEILLGRRYCRDGSGGGMFYVPNSDFDLTKMDFFRQAQIWLSRNFV